MALTRMRSPARSGESRRFSLIGNPTSAFVADAAGSQRRASFVSSPVFEKEAARLAALAAYDVLDTPRERDFDEVASIYQSFRDPEFSREQGENITDVLVRSLTVYVQGPSWQDRALAAEAELRRIKGDQ